MENYAYSAGVDMTQEALKMALDALETELSIDWTNNNEFNASAEKMYKAITAIKEALAQEQEPVADDFFRMIADKNPKPFPLPERTWVGLTDDETALIAADCSLVTPSDFYFVKAIEAKLKELNT